MCWKSQPLWPQMRDSERGFQTAWLLLTQKTFAGQQRYACDFLRSNWNIYVYSSQKNAWPDTIDGWCMCKGAVCYGLEPSVVTTRRSTLTYGVEVLHRFNAERHPTSKKIHKDGVDWCTGVFDTFVHVNQVYLLTAVLIGRLRRRSQNWRTGSKRRA